MGPLLEDTVLGTDQTSYENSCYMLEWGNFPGAKKLKYESLKHIICTWMHGIKAVGEHCFSSINVMKTRGWACIYHTEHATIIHDYYHLYRMWISIIHSLYHGFYHVTSLACFPLGVDVKFILGCCRNNFTSTV